MNIWEAARIAIRVLRLYRLRSALTMLGIIIGVAAVILLVAIGSGVQSSINAQFEPLVTLITVKKVEGNVPGGGAPKELRDSDATALEKQASDIATVLPITSGEVVAETQNTTSRATVIGSTPQWLDTNSVDIAVGSFFDSAQFRSSAKVVVLGPTVVANLFGADPQTALNRTIHFNHQFFKVIGMLQPAGEPGDSMIIMPLNTARSYVYGGGETLTELRVHATRAAAVPAAVNEVAEVLSQRHGIHDPTKRDFQVQSWQGALASFQQTLRILTLFTASVAAISLLVGGIGVLNIMLVSVTERTREIGIRKAIGATRRAVLTQFLIESTILAGLGGLIGVVLGISLSALSTTVAPSFDPALAQYTPAVGIPVVVASFAVSLAIGLVAGGYPAYRAARLHPVEALRHE
jgi:putative ABC transport system permease protein